MISQCSLYISEETQIKFEFLKLELERLVTTIVTIDNLDTKIISFPMPLRIRDLEILNDFLASYFVATPKEQQDYFSYESDLHIHLSHYYFDIVHQDESCILKIFVRTPSQILLGGKFTIFRDRTLQFQSDLAEFLETLNDTEVT